MLAIYKRELRSYFTTPIGYVFYSVFLAIAAVVCSFTTIKSSTPTTNVSRYFTAMLFVLVIVAPLLTMKLFSEEKKLRTEQLLLTAPVSITGMVFAKYLASLTLYASALLITSVNTIPLFVYAEPDGAIILGNYIAIFLVGSAFLAIGIFMSSLTENQLAAAVSTTAVLLVLLVISFANSAIDNYIIRSVLSWFSIYSRYSAFTYGIFDWVAVLYYLSISFVFCYLTIRVYEQRRWKS
ncbi:MAG: ABC transporter [Clostridia bacterium]|nr:ABC transporter [Clostridia bacterium]